MFLACETATMGSLKKAGSFRWEGFASLEDLRNQLWTNEAEARGKAGVDDDGNGYVDDVRGWDFYSGDNNPNPVDVDDAHGTCTAGLAAAVGINGLGTVPITAYTIGFGVLLVAGLLMIILGFEVLDSPIVVIVSTIISSTWPWMSLPSRMRLRSA